MSILNNAVSSIQVGVEDYKSESEARMLAAVRSVMAGLLLLYKEKLRRLSPPHDPEALIKSKVVPATLPDGSISFIGKGKKTADFHQIKERFEDFSVAVDWKRAEKIRNLRNDIEHYYTTLSRDNVKELLATSLVLIRDFLSHELSEEPLELLGDDCWNTLLEISEIYDKEKSECMHTLGRINWSYQTLKDCTEYFRCTNCNSALVKTNESGVYQADMPLFCSSCGHTFDVEGVLELAVDELLGIDAYIAAKDGDEPPYGTCPSCTKETFIFSEHICIACENELDYKNCWRCDSSLSLEEQELDGMCSYCSHIAEKLWLNNANKSL